MTVEIPLTKGQVAIVDDIDADLAQLKWVANFQKKYGGEGAYLALRHFRESGKRKGESLHRVILARIIGRELLRSEETDHIDGNPLNNQRDNLRIASRTQNNRNRRMHSNNTSGFKGVHFSKRFQRWYAVIGVNGKSIYLGCFRTPEEAHEAYKEAAIRYHGEFARFE